MHLDGTHALPAPREKIWNMLLDPEVLERVVPGVKTLEPEGEGVYKAISEVKMGPVSGSFTGQMEVADQKPPESFVLKMKQNSKIGNVSAEGTIGLKPLENDQTEITFSGDAKLSGTLARMGQRVLSGVAKSMTKQFFQALEDELTSDHKETEKEAGTTSPLSDTESEETQSNKEEKGSWQNFLDKFR